MDVQQILDTVALEVLEGPTAKVETDDREPWPCVAYKLRLMRDGREIMTFPYRFGVGHFKPTKAEVDRAFGSLCGPFAADLQHMIATRFSKHFFNPKDKQLEADSAVWVAKLRKHAPTVADVLPALLMDGAAFMDAQTFEDWAADFGYDEDSRKAERDYHTCDATGRKLAGSFSSDELDALREWANEQ